jgi:antibiotic biosynthesis monooxygenase (ABM) superfamily enzyme
MTTTALAPPVKMVIERTVHDAQRATFEAWARRYVTAAARAPGHEGTSVLGPAGGQFFLLVRFHDQAALAAWCESAEARALDREADAFSTAADRPQVRTGLETWFNLPGAPPPPPKWKMAVTTWAALYPMALVLATLLAPFPMPFAVNVALNTAIPVALLTWVAMPWLKRLLEGWLYAGRAGGSDER